MIPVLPFTRDGDARLNYGKEVVVAVPVTCRFCDHVATDSVEHLERAFP